MWDLGTALLAVAVVAAGAIVLPPVARGVGGACLIIGLLGGVGHWSFAVRNDARYRSRLARVVIDQTPLRWTLPQFWELRQRRRADG